MLFSAVAVVNAKDLLSSVIISGIFSLLAVLIYIVMRAADVAITEVAVGSSISTVFLLICVHFIGKDVSDPKPKVIDGMLMARALLCLTVFIVFSILLLNLDQFGDAFEYTNGNNIGAYYLKNTKIDFDISNIVTAILGGYRGFDTLFETAVIFTAAIGCYHLLYSDNNRKK